MWIKPFMLLVTVFLTGCTVFGIRTSEEPAYRVIHKQGRFQVRQYSELIIAETEVEAEFDESGSIAFRRLAGYIFGKNRKKEKISMTTPVVREPESEKIAMTAPVTREKGGNTWVWSFVMPEKYTLETLPVPLDSRIVIRTVPAKRIALIRFSGRVSEKKFREKSAELFNWLESSGYTAVSAPKLAGYDPPWTIPFLRRNEVQVEVSD